MKAAPLPHNETERLKALEELELMDTLPEKVYDEITALASEICGTPASFLTLIDERRQWFKSKYGSDANETPREQAFCAHAILNPDDVFIVQDARYDERFFDNPLTSSEPPVVFYAGVPVKDANNNAVGALCVIDSRPRDLSEQKIESLKTLGKLVNVHFELRQRKIELNKIHTRFKDATEKVKAIHEIVETLVKSDKSLDQATHINALQETIKSLKSLL